MYSRVGVLVIASLGAPSPARAEQTALGSPSGFTATLVGGLNVDTPFVELELGRRFDRAPHFELYLDYSYGAAISEFSFQTFGAGVRTYFFEHGRVELFHQALLALGVSSSGNGVVEDRAIGERLLGAFMTQGLGAQVQLTQELSLTLGVATGYPVWLRSDVGVRFTF